MALEPGSLVADGAATATATATVTDAGGNPVPGDQLQFSATDPGVRFGPVVDHGDGTYAAAVTASTAVGSRTITAEDVWASPSVSGSATLTQTPGPASQVALTLQPASVPADGASTTTATATVADAGGHPVSGDDLAFSSTEAGQVIGPVVDHGDGTYTAQITSSALVGTASLTLTDTSVVPPLEASTTLTQSALPPQSIPEVRTPPRESSPPTAPGVAITRHPAKRIHERRPRFRFVMTDELGASFECKLDSGGYRPCTSPLRLPKLSVGLHRFKVRVVGRDGIVGTAASSRFVVIAAPAR